MRYKGFQKAIRKKEININYRRLAVYFAILYFILAIPLLIVAIIGFVNDINYLTYVWIYVAVAVLGIAGILYANISKQFIQPHDQTTETV